MLRRLRRRRPRWRDGEKLRHGFFDDLLCRFDLVDQTGRLSGERGRGFHVAVEIDVSNCLQRVRPSSWIARVRSDFSARMHGAYRFARAKRVKIKQGMLRGTTMHRRRLSAIALALPNP
jgi:hypothetical protein